MPQEPRPVPVRTIMAVIGLVLLTGVGVWLLHGNGQELCGSWPSNSPLRRGKPRHLRITYSG